MKHVEKGNSHSVSETVSPCEWMDSPDEPSIVIPTQLSYAFSRRIGNANPV
jgi:hypothetical protein